MVRQFNINDMFEIGKYFLKKLLALCMIVAIFAFLWLFWLEMLKFSLDF